MLEVVDRLGAALLDASLAATAITGLVVLAMIQCRQPARRRDWARAGLLATLALLPLAALNPVPRIDLRGPLRDLLSTSLEAPPTSTPREDRLIWKSFPERPRPEDGFDDPGTATGQTGRLRQVARSLIVLYLLGFSIGLGGLGLGLWGSARLVRRGRIPSASSLLILRLLPFDGAWSTPRLLVSDQTSRPVLLGGLRPTILIPSELDGSDAVEALLVADTVPITRERKGREEVDDLRPSVLALAVARPGSDRLVDPTGRTVGLVAELSTQPRGVRPVELVRGLIAVSGGPPGTSSDGRASDGRPGSIPVLDRACRTHQWIERDGLRQEPLLGRAVPARSDRAVHALERAS